MRKVVLVKILVLLTILQATSQNRTTQIIPPKSFEGATLSALAINVKSGDTLFSYHPQTRLIPASTLKLFTTATALEKLGANFTFKTTISTTGYIDNGTLKGNLIINNGGDPTLGSSNFAEQLPEQILKVIHEKLKEKGISKIEGKIVVKNNIYPLMEIPKGRVFDDVANYYGAAPNSLCWRDNTFTINLQSDGKQQSKCKVVNYENLTKTINIDCQVVASSKAQDSAYIYMQPNGDYTLQGSIPLNQSSFAIKGATPSPSNQFVAELSNYLTKNKLLILNKKVVVTPNSKLDTLITITSPTLLEIAKITNQKSNNLYADALFLALAKDIKHPHIWDGAALEMKNYWDPHIDLPLKIADGSGLSVRNLLSANQLIDLLSYMFQSANFSNYQSTLAIAGKTGTLKNSFTTLKGVLYGKSGSMEGVVCYAGYYYNQKGEIIAFAIMVNNFIVEPKEVKKDIELILRMMDL